MGNKVKMNAVVNTKDYRCSTWRFSHEDSAAYYSAMDQFGHENPRLQNEMGCISYTCQLFRHFNPRFILGTKQMCTQSDVGPTLLHGMTTSDEN